MKFIAAVFSSFLAISANAATVTFDSGSLVFQDSSGIPLNTGFISIYNFGAKPQSVGALLEAVDRETALDTIAFQTGVNIFDGSFGSQASIPDGDYSSDDIDFVIGNGPDIESSTSVTFLSRLLTGPDVAGAAPGNPQTFDNVSFVAGDFQTGFVTLDGNEANLVPVPEPSTGLLAFAGLALALRRKR